MSAHTIEAVLTARDQGFTSTFDKAVQKTESFGAKLKSGLGFGAWMAIGQKAVSTVFSAVNSSVDGAVKRFDTLNNFPKVMLSLGYGADEAKASIDALGKGIEFLPTTLDAVASQTKSVVAVTGDLDKATKLTLALNNAMTAGGASAEQASGAINQWTQAMAKGKPDLQDWRALVQTAPAQMNQLAEATLGAGKTQNDLYEALKKGSISMEEVNDAMIKLSEEGGKGITSWAEQAKNAGAGIQMAMTNVKAGMQRNIANVISSVDEMLSSFGGISGVIQSVVPVMDKFGETISAVIKGDMSLGDAVQGMLDSLGEKAQEFIPKGAEFIMNLIAGIGTQLPQMITAGLNAITKMIEGLGSGEGELGAKAVQMVAKIVVAFVKASPQMLLAGIKLVDSLLNGLSNMLGKAVTQCIAYGKKIFQSIKKGLGSLVATGSNYITGLWNAMKAKFSTAVSGAILKAKSILHGIKTGLGSLVSVGSNLIAGLWNGIKAKFDSVVGKVKALASKLPKAVKKVLGIASPSKVMYKLGEYTGEGFANGIEAMNRAVELASLNLVKIPNAQAMGFNADASYEYGASYTIDVPLYINGREFARATAGDMQTVMNQNEVRQNRLRGIR